MRSLIQTMAKWFAGPEAARPTSAASPPADDESQPEPSITEFFPHHDATEDPTTFYGGATERDRTQGGSEESVVIDIVDADDLEEVADLADGTPDPPQGEQPPRVRPWTRQRSSK
jgi:hypothetical protein